MIIFNDLWLFSHQHLQLTVLLITSEEKSRYCAVNWTWTLTVINGWNCRGRKNKYLISRVYKHLFFLQKVCKEHFLLDVSRDLFSHHTKGHTEHRHPAIPTQGPQPEGFGESMKENTLLGKISLLRFFFSDCVSFRKYKSPFLGHQQAQITKFRISR